MFTDVIDMVSVLLSTIQLIDMAGTSAPNSDSQRYWNLVRRLQVFIACMVLWYCIPNVCNRTNWNRDFSNGFLLLHFSTSNHTCNDLSAKVI